MDEMRVLKRDGNLEEVSFDKILSRIKKLGHEAGIQINYSALVMKVIDQLHDKIETRKIDELAAEQCASLSTLHCDYATLAARIVISNHQKNTCSSFSEVMRQLYNFKNIHGIQKPLVSERLWAFVSANASAIDAMIDHNRDYLFDFFGFKTLERGYLFKIGDIIIERIQHMWMRVSIGIHGEDLKAIQETYDLMSQKYFIHATPTLFNAGTPRPQLSSCFLIAMESDSIDGIYDTLKDCANISKYSGGIGLHIHNIRAKDSHIQGTNGKTDGLVPMLKVFNATARYVNQSGKRSGSFAIYLEPWHPDIDDFLEMKKNHGDEEMKARDLFYALWISDLFMERVKDNAKWSLFCPHECPGLADVYGEKFRELYAQYEIEGRARKVVNARDLWFRILDAQMETGTPYLLFKDAVNFKSNQQNLGTIKSSNLCVAPETVILTDKGHIEIQNLEGQNIRVWNGEEFSNVDVIKTGTDQELIDVYTDDGSKLTCTPYHKFHIQETYSMNSIKIVDAQDLKPNDKLIKCDYPVIDGTDTFLDPYEHGFFCGDGTYGTDTMNILHDLKPLPNSSLKDKIKWFDGYCDANGTIKTKNDEDFLTVKSANEKLLLEVKYLLQTCGINPKINYKNQKGLVYIPLRNNEGELRSYEINTYFCLLLTSCDLHKLVKLGFSPKRLKVSGNKPKKSDDEKIIKILKIKNNNRVDDTYCFTEPKRHMGVFNGILTGQCSEIMQYSDNKETAVCNLASIGLPTYVENGVFNYEKLHEVVKVVTKNLNRVIDVNFYPTNKARDSNMHHRPIGLGVQGLADTFVLMDIAFHSDAAKNVNKLIFETIYHAALERSCELAVSEGAYQSFAGSPASKGILQFDMWSVAPSDRYDWAKLKAEIAQNGLRNSLLVAPMPTASTSQILGFNECFEPFTSNLYSRRTMAGEFVVINKYLVKELIALGQWNEEVKNNIVANMGSVQQLSFLTEHMKQKYKIVWEIPMKHVIDMSADRGAFVCQSQSLNLWVEDPTYNTLTSMHFYSWKKGLKTGIYYLRRKAKHQAQQFTIEPEKKVHAEEHDEICEMCSG